MLPLPLVLSWLVLLASCSSTPAAEGVRELTIDYMVWSEDLHGGQDSLLLAHIRDWEGPPDLHGFTARADKVFSLEAAGPGGHRARARTGTGGLTCAEHGRFVVLHMGRGLLPDLDYALRPRNHDSNVRWSVAEGVVIRR
ncbi:MAG: hypothetical protein CMJ89_05230 [Planctomycetes bacterium]|nr:hypothetical protein [Planctomycetota bacterium]